jgi:hypothetical protein
LGWSLALHYLVETLLMMKLLPVKLLSRELLLMKWLPRKPSS